MAGKLAPYYPNGVQDEENCLWISLAYITALRVIFDPEGGVWVFTIELLKGAPLSSFHMTMEEAMQELDEWRFLVNSADSGQPVQ